MSVFALKLLATASMLIDHTGYMLALAGKAGAVTVTAMRAIGRLAFPIYCFLIVNGLRKTSDRVAYLSRLAVFALISQIPFTLLAYRGNYLPLAGQTALRIAPDCSAVIYALLAAVTATVFFLMAPKGRHTVSAAAAALFAFLPCVELYCGGAKLLDGYMNVFYTLTLGLACIDLLDRFRARAFRDGSGGYPLWRLIISAALLAALLFLVQPAADYGPGGVVLIAAIYLCFESRTALAAVMCLWSLWTYWYQYGSAVYALSCCLAVLSLLPYKGKKGRDFKLGFYLVYPIHLLILGLTNIFVFNAH